MIAAHHSGGAVVQRIPNPGAIGATHKEYAMRFPMILLFACGLYGAAAFDTAVTNSGKRGRFTFLRWSRRREVCLPQRADVTFRT